MGDRLVDGVGCVWWGGIWRTWCAVCQGVAEWTERSRMSALRRCLFCPEWEQKLSDETTRSAGIGVEWGAHEPSYWDLNQDCLVLNAATGRAEDEFCFPDPRDAQHYCSICDLGERGGGGGGGGGARAGAGREQERGESGRGGEV